MMQKPHEFELEDDARITDAESPDTEPLDSGDSYNAPERHWLARFSTVVFCIGLLAGVSGTTAVTNAWIQRDVSVVLMLLSAGSAAAFLGSSGNSPSEKSDGIASHRSTKSVTE